MSAKFDLEINNKFIIKNQPQNLQLESSEDSSFCFSEYKFILLLKRISGKLLHLQISEEFNSFTCLLKWYCNKDLCFCNLPLTKLTTIFLFYWPCISIHPCNKNQLDALFILSLFRQSTSTCFRHICSPSPGGILYIYIYREREREREREKEKLLRFVLFSWLSFGRQANIQSTKKRNTCQLLYIYSIPPDDGLQICPKHVQVSWLNKLRIN